MAKAPEPKTRPTDVPVAEFLSTIEPSARRAEAQQIVELMTAATGVAPIMWGESIVGWGETSMTYANGSELSWPALGYSPRATQHTLYLLQGFDLVRDELARLGPHTLGRGCLYIKRLDRIEIGVLSELVARAWETA